MMCRFNPRVGQELKTRKVFNLPVIHIITMSCNAVRHGEVEKLKKFPINRETVVKILGHVCPLRAWCNAWVVW
jgi:hypothetical protein